MTKDTDDRGLLVPWAHHSVDIECTRQQRKGAHIQRQYSKRGQAQRDVGVNGQKSVAGKPVLDSEAVRSVEKTSEPCEYNHTRLGARIGSSLRRRRTS